MESYQNGSSLAGLVTSEDQRAYEEYQGKIRRKALQRRLFCTLLVAFVVAGITMTARLIFTRAARNSRLKNATPQKQIEWLNRAVATNANVELGCTSTIVLMRHCEKFALSKKDKHRVTDSNGDHHCSAMGSKRAEYLPSLFGKNSRWPTPYNLYAMNPKRPGVHHMTYRQIETLTPLANAFNMTINSHYTNGHSPYLAEEFFYELAKGKLCGKSTVISWKHSRIPEISEALGCGPNEGCPKKYPKKSFDQVWIITYTYTDADSTKRQKNEGIYIKQKAVSTGTWSVQGRVTRAGFKPPKLLL